MENAKNQPSAILLHRLLSPYSMLILALLALWNWVFRIIVEYTNLRPGIPFTYTLDDAYIHMAIARNLALHGVWGINAGEFASASSSILWTLILSGIYRLFGVHDLTSFYLNVLFGSLAVVFAWRVLRQLKVTHPFFLLASLLLVIYITPFPTLVVSGMETTLQIFLTFAFVDAGLLILSDIRQPIRSKQTLYLLVTALLYAAVRYEDLGIIAIFCLILLFQRRFRLAITLGAVAVFPAILFGLISTGQGWWFLPNSILIKNSQQLSLSFLQRLEALEVSPFMFYLRWMILTGLFGLIAQQWLLPRPKAGKAHWIVLSALSVLIAQYFLGILGWFYRYEAYLIALGIIGLVGMGREWFAFFNAQTWKRFSKNMQLRILFAALIFGGAFLSNFLLSRSVYSLSMRAGDAQRNAPIAMMNIHDQQLQMAAFVRKYYAGSCIAANDIGAVSYQGSGCVVDVYGLGNHDIAQATLQKTSLVDTMQKLAQQKNIQIAIVYPKWFPQGFPENWIPVGEWTIPNNVVAAEPTVRFYAVGAERVLPLRQQLKEFASSLPDGVTWQIYP